MRAIALAALPLALAACAGPPITSPIDGEPVCPDFETGAAHTKMVGSLKNPVRLTIKNGSAIAFKTTISGLRTEKDIATRVLLADDNDTLTLEWAQCDNERAPKPVTPAGHEAKDAVKYDCGEAKVYKTDQLTIKKGDPKSHTITFVMPPNSECWKSTAPVEPADAGSPDASADDAGTAAATDAGPTDADGGATDAGASDAGSTGTAAADAGATDAGSTDAGSSDAGKGASNKPK